MRLAQFIVGVFAFVAVIGLIELLIGTFEWMHERKQKRERNKRDWFQP